MRPHKVMLLVERSSKNTYIRHQTKLLFLGDVLAKTIICWGLKSLFGEAILKYLVNVLRKSTSFEVLYILKKLKNLKHLKKIK